MEPRLTLNWQFSCLCFLSTRTAGMHHHTWRGQVSCTAKYALDMCKVTACLSHEPGTVAECKGEEFYK
jgi:hypothetical protein